VIERFGAAEIPPEKISFVRDTFTFNFPGGPADDTVGFGSLWLSRRAFTIQHLKPAV
jgi:hypothetical protein